MDARIINLGLRVVEIKNHRVKLQIIDGQLGKALAEQEFFLPKRLFPLNIKEGEVWVMEIKSKEQADTQKQEVARIILEQILNEATD